VFPPNAGRKKRERPATTQAKNASVVHFSENQTGCGDLTLLLPKGSFAQRVCFRCVLLCREINRSIFGRQAPV